MITRYGPLVGVLLFWSIGFGWRSWLQRRRYGSSGVVLFRSGSWAQHLRESGMLVVLLVMLSEGLAAAFSPQHLAALWIVGPPTPFVVSGGLAVVAIAIVLLVAAQLHMGASWRVGIDLDARPGLVTSGVYAFSRNPIYLSVCVALVGFLLMLPTWLSLLLCVGMPFGFRQQVNYEEAYLRQAYGDDFDRYAQRVGRFLPGIGRLA